jgi:hypothetical protein
LFDGLSFDGFPPFEYGPNRLLLASIFWRPLRLRLFLDGLPKQLCHVVSTGGSVDEDGLNFMLSVVKGIVNTQEAMREADRCHSVADLSAGFWVALLNASYNIAFSWRYNLARIFPVLLCAGCDRAAIALRHPGESPEREGSFGRIDAHLYPARVQPCSTACWCSRQSYSSAQH